MSFSVIYLKKQFERRLLFRNIRKNVRKVSIESIHLFYLIAESLSIFDVLLSHPGTIIVPKRRYI